MISTIRSRARWDGVEVVEFIWSCMISTLRSRTHWEGVDVVEFIFSEQTRIPYLSLHGKDGTRASCWWL